VDWIWSLALESKLLLTLMISVGLTALAILSFALYLGSREPDLAAQTAQRQVIAGIHRMRPLLQLVVILLGAATAWYSIIEFSTHQQRLREQRRQDAYQDLGDSYVAYLRECRQDVWLDCYDLGLRELGIEAPELGPEDQVRQRVVYAMLFNHFEQAHTRFRDDPGFWCGWERYMDRYLEREAVRRAWIEIADTWGSDFQCFMRKRLLDRFDTSVSAPPGGCPPDPVIADCSGGGRE